MTSIKVLRKALNSLFSGIIFLVAGIIIQLGKLYDSVDSGYIIGKYWPLMVILFGIKYILFSLIGVSQVPKEGSPEVEEKTSYLLHSYNPAGGIVWGSGLIVVGMILFLNLHENTTVSNILSTYWPTFLIIGGLSGIMGCFLILYRYFKIHMMKS